MRPIQSARSAGAGKGALRRLALTGVLLAFALGWMVPPVAAQITSVSPGSAHVAPGSSVGVSVTTDLSNVSLAAGSAPGVTVGKGGSAPTFTFTFTAFTSATPGTYSYTFTDGASTGSFTLTVDSPPATTTTTTTTTRPPTTTTRPPTTTTRPTTT
ncbi:MAG: hypothetical protein U9R47_03705, partial [Actinomycetota bacterium]|nr:hypothetical protein [Actinomycetota bacterium]